MILCSCSPLNAHGQGHSAISWTAGAVYSQAEYRAYLQEREEAVKVGRAIVMCHMWETTCL